MDASEIKRYISENFDGLGVTENEGDTFFFYDPDDLPANRMFPFVTIVTGDNYDSVSNLGDGSYRLNIGLTKATYTSMFGRPPSARDEHGVLETGFDHAVRDRLVPHPVYASQHWVSVINPSEATFEQIRPLLAEAHEFAARKHANAQGRSR